MMVVNCMPHVRPCRSIPSDGLADNEWSTSIPTQHAVLTQPLPLAGGAMLERAGGSGEARLASTLRAEAPWMAAFADRIAERAALSLWAGRPWLALPPMLLVGPPGAGKTYLARRLGSLSGCGDAVLSFAGVNSNAVLAGNPRGFRHPQPCLPAMVMQRTNTANPVIVIDEVEKAMASDLGDPVATLIGLLEGAGANRYFDGCLAAEIDLSHINWVMTANRIDQLPAALLSRVEVIDVSGPRPEDAEQVLPALWRDVAHQLDLPPSELPKIEQAAETALLRLFRRTRSVRRLRQAIETLVAVSACHRLREVH
jgi:ATP-dependent Lon protease